MVDFYILYNRYSYMDRFLKKCYVRSDWCILYRARWVHNHNDFRLMHSINDKKISITKNFQPVSLNEIFWTTFPKNINLIFCSSMSHLLPLFGDRTNYFHFVKCLIVVCNEKLRKEIRNAWRKWDFTAVEVISTSVSIVLVMTLWD